MSLCIEAGHKLVKCEYVTLHYGRSLPVVEAIFDSNPAPQTWVKGGQEFHVVDLALCSRRFQIAQLGCSLHPRRLQIYPLRNGPMEHAEENIYDLLDTQRIRECG